MKLKLFRTNLLFIFNRTRLTSNIRDKLIESIRSSFQKAGSKEELHKRLMFFFAPLRFFYKNAMPGNLCTSDVRARRQFILENSQSPAVDIGMLDGYFVRELKNKGIDTIGVDCIKQMVKYAKKKDPDGNYITAFAENLPFEDNSFSTVICSHVLEHVLDPKAILKETFRILAPGGRILVIVPFDLGLEPTHLREYTKESLLEESGQFFSSVKYFEKIGAGHGYIGIK